MSNPLQPRWTVISQQEQRRPTPAGQFVSGVVVGFSTATGLSGSIFVADTDYTPDKVRAAINARVAQLESVHSLTG